MSTPPEGQEPETDSKSELPKLEETIAAECLDILLREYEIERGKRRSFEDRAGIVVAVLAAVCVFVLEKMPLPENREIAEIASGPILKDVVCAFTYISFFTSLLCSINTLRIRIYQNFAVENVGEWLFAKPPFLGTAQLIGEYREIIKQHREQNAEVARSLMRSMIFLCIFLALTVIYMNM